MMRSHVGKTMLLLMLALVASLLPAPVQAQVLDDDLFLFSSTFPPNVVLLQDNSISMNHIEWHWAFDSNAVPDCSYWDNDLDYVVGTDISAGNLSLNAVDTPDSDCWNTRRIYDTAENPADTIYSGRYLNWYFSDAADPYENEIKTAKHVPPSCNQPACSDCDEKYRRTRSQMSKQILLDVLCLAEDKGVRFGQATFRDGENAPTNDDPNGGYVQVGIDDPSPPHASNLEAAIKNIKSLTGTPLAEALFQLYTYFMPRVLADMPLGDDGLTPFPPYTYKLSTGEPVVLSKAPADPVQGSCQRNFVVLVTDGKPDHDDFDADPVGTAAGFSQFNSLIGNYYADAEIEFPGDPDETGWCLDDVAKYMHDKDFRPDLPDDQTLDVYTIGLATDSATDVFLQRTADLSDGLFFHAQDGDQLAQALLNAINDIIEKSQSFTAATVPSSRTASGGDFYTSFFVPQSGSAFWEGHLRAWQITATGDILDANGDCALLDPDAGECNSGPFLEDAVPYWDAGQQVSAPSLRSLYTSKVVAGSPQRVPLDQSLTAADLNLAAFSNPGSPPDPTPNSPLYLAAGSSATSEEGLADEVVAFARGCTFGTGVAANVDVPLPCEARLWRLGDIFHSGPVVVTRPKALIREQSYKDFQTNHATRKRVIYVGTNGGFVHGIDAGDWDVSLDPDAYNQGSGTELFGFMPWQARQNIKNQPIDDPTSRTYFVDGSPQAGDVWIHPAPGTTTKNASEWRTVVVGGMRQGGSQYYALDVTDPSGAAGPYPGYLWEFPCEFDAGDPCGTNADLPNMGETWSEPIITRVKVNYSGTTVERWVAVVTGGYADESDPNNVAYDPTATVGRGIYLLDMKTGEVLAERKYDPLGNCTPPVVYDPANPERSMCYAIVGAPAVLDLDYDGFADVLYAGDLGGNLWKWAIGAVGEDRVNDGSGLRTQPAWPFGRFFEAPTATIGGTTYYKSLFTTPAAAYEGRDLYVAFASGERTDLGFAGVPADPAENNRFYVVKEPDTTSVAADPQTESDPDGPGPRQGLTDVTGTQTCTPINGPGYFFRAADGEKFVTRTNIFASFVIGASFTPTNSPDPCVPKGDATLYVFRLSCGEGHFDDGSGNPIRSLDIGGGLPTDPQISLGVGGMDNRIYIEKSGGDLESIEGDDTVMGGRILYWREVP